MFEQQLKILVVDDDSGDAELLRRRLASVGDLEFEFQHHSKPVGAVERVREEAPDVVFVDFHLGAATGLDLLHDIRLRGITTSVIMLTGQGSEEVATKCIHAGADDYLSKADLETKTLRRALQHAQAQQARRKAEAKLRMIQFSIDYASDPVFWVGKNGRFVYVNEAACESLGYARHQLLEMSVMDVVPDLSKEKFLKRWNKTERAGSTTFEELHRRRDGSTFPVEVNVNYIQFRDMNLVCAFVRDVTERKQAEQKLREQEEQLRQAQKLEAVGALAGGIAHEFNNLLQAIQGYTGFAIEGLPEDEQRFLDLRQVQKAAERAARLTTQLLGFSRRRQLQPAIICPNEMVAELGKMISPLIGEHIELQTVLADDIGTVRADPTVLQQILMNLCVNARDAMTSGGRLVISTNNLNYHSCPCPSEDDPKPGPYVLLSVSDTGCGMSPEVREHAFEPFFTTKEVGKGTGLGLAMVYGAVRQHDGMIHVYSEPGQGTTFKIYLPAITSPTRTADSEEPVLPPGGSETILVAEDEAMVRNLAVRILEDAGYTVLRAADGEEAIEVFRENQATVSLALLDMVMPTQSGREVCHRIKRLKPETKVIFCSGYDPAIGLAELAAEQEGHFIQKPFEPIELLKTVRDALNMEQQWELASAAL